MRASGRARAARLERHRRPPPAGRDRDRARRSRSRSRSCCSPSSSRAWGSRSGAARTLAIVVLIGFGVALLIPDLTARVEAPLSRLGRFGPKTRGTGFWSGLGVGAALGFVCAPCAGPILAAVTSVSASSGANARVVLVAISYSVGLSAVLLVYAFAGRAVIDRIRRVGAATRQPGPRRRAPRDRGPDGHSTSTSGSRRPSPRTESPRDPRRSDAVARELERRPEAAARRCDRRRGSSRRGRRLDRTGGNRRRRGSRSRRQDPSLPTSAPRRTSPTPRTGSTPPATAR